MRGGGLDICVLERVSTRTKVMDWSGEVGGGREGRRELGFVFV